MLREACGNAICSFYRTGRIVTDRDGQDYQIDFEENHFGDHFSDFQDNESELQHKKDNPNIHVFKIPLVILPISGYGMQSTTTTGL